MNHKPARLLMTLAFGLLLSSTAHATLIGAGGGSLVQSWGKDNTQTYGQTVTVPTENVLNSFSFWLGRTSTNYPDPPNPSLDFMAYVYEWNEGSSLATGSALYTSGVATHNATPSTPFTQYTFSTGGLSLVSGGTYVLFFSTSGLTGSGRIQWEAASSDEYAGGHFVFQNNGEDSSLWTTAMWGSGYVSDLHFEADFGGSAAVPEPSTCLMLVMGLLASAVATLRR